MTSFRRLWKWIKDQVVQTVPEKDAVCEFECRKLQCTGGEWEICQRRLQAIEKPALKAVKT
jgi:hypothetical protein